MLVAAQAAAQAEPGGLTTGYESLLREYRSFQPLPDTAASGPTSREVAERIAEALRARSDSTSADDDGVRRLEVDGLVVDQSITRVGREFYDVFYRLWTPPREAVSYTVEIVEQPAFRITTAVRVQVNGELAYQSQIQPRSDDIEERARQAVAAVYRRLQTRSMQPTEY